jgi:DNA-binding MarR family transcriptional regulator
MQDSEPTRLLRALTAMSEDLERDLPITAALVFLGVARHGCNGVDQGGLQEALGLSSAGISRTVQTLGKVHYLKGKEGLDLVSREMDPSDNRRRVLRLTSRGEKLMRSVVRAMDS